MSRREKAAQVVGRALALQKKGQLERAIELYGKASAIDPSWSVPPYNLGLLFKLARNWKEALKYNRRATALDSKNKAAWWNFGIAATALGRWNLARSAWRGFGIAVPDGDGPIDLPCGFCPIRIDPNGQAEVVWGHRIDPARASLASIPLPEPKHHWKDVVLNDGAPNGYRRHQGKEVPVFDALELLEPSPFGTYVAHVKMPATAENVEKGAQGQAAQVAQLAQLAGELGGNAEDWSTSLRMICKACSEGRPHQKHDSEAAPPGGVHLIGIAARDREHAAKILSGWQSGRNGIEVESLDDALEPGASQ
jgi:tetratricopeptide (TPR) repeat protein